jgi:glycosyltransferase involved in cell wall biosynthesis
MRMAKLAKYLPEHGWDVLVLCSEERNPIQFDPGLASEIPAEVEIRRIRGPLNRLGGKATTSVASASRGRGLGVLARFAVKVARTALIPDRWIGWAWTVSRMPLRDLRRVDVVLSSGPPHSTHIAARRLAARLGVPFVADLRDDWSTDPFGWNVAPWQGPLNELLERRTLPQAERLVVVSAPMKAGVESRLPAVSGRVDVLPNGFDPADLAGLPRREPRRPEDPIHILFAGRLLANQTLGRLPEALRAMQKELQGGVRLDLVGVVDPIHINAAHEHLGSNVTARGHLPHRDALAAMALADVLLLVILGGAMLDANMTGKIFEYLGLRRPILALAPSGVARELVVSSGAGAAADPANLEDCVAAVRTVVAMANDPDFGGAPDEVLAMYDRRVLAGRWSDLLDTVVSRSD